MVHFAPLISAAALFAGLASAVPRPRPDSAVGPEVAVSAPNGVVLSDTAELASQLSSESAAAAATDYPAIVTSSPAWESVAAVSSVSVDTAAPDSIVTPPPYSSSDSAAAAAYTPPPAVYSSASYSAAAAYSSPAYGSGSSGWGSGYDSCVQQCVASFGGLSASYAPPTPTDAGSTGATHTVIVAPTQGVLRYVPFVVNASIGDTVHFVWMANNHTVTKSSELEICNKTSAQPFASGTHDKGFTFDQVVNDTNPTFFYCGTPGHCQKGMFGIINPPSEANANTSVALMMSSLTASNPDLAAADKYVNTKTAGSDAANNWGGNINLASLPDWSHDYVAENVLYARSFMAANPDVVKDDGSIDLNTNAPLSWPSDLSAAVASASASSSAATPSATGSGSGSAPSAASSAGASSPSGTPTGKTSGGVATKAISGSLLAAAAIAGAFLSL